MNLLETIRMLPNILGEGTMILVAWLCLLVLALVVFLVLGRCAGRGWGRRRPPAGPDHRGVVLHQQHWCIAGASRHGTPRAPHGRV